MSDQDNSIDNSRLCAHNYANIMAKVCSPDQVNNFVGPQLDICNSSKQYGNCLPLSFHSEMPPDSVSTFIFLYTTMGRLGSPLLKVTSTEPVCSPRLMNSLTLSARARSCRKQKSPSCYKACAGTSQKSASLRLYRLPSQYKGHTQRSSCQYLQHAFRTTVSHQMTAL